MDIFDTLKQLGYGELHFGRDEATGMRAIIGLHSTRLGPAIGGSRIRLYASEAEAIDDVTRLAQAMSFKAAIAGLRHGGGKAVLLAPPELGHFDSERRAALFRSFGRFVDGLGGRYITTEDSGTSPADMDVIRSVTKHVLGASAANGGSGDPSPFTALGVRRGIEAIAHKLLGRKDLDGLHVAVQGVGHVGEPLVAELAALGARLTVSDVDHARAERVARMHRAELVAPDAILTVECDVLSPCALGGAITEELVPHLRTKVVAGAANNQLRTAEAGRQLMGRGIFYAPDYAINGGGLINVADEFAGYSGERATAKTMAIYDTIVEILDRSRRDKRPPELVADKMAEERIAAG